MDEAKKGSWERGVKMFYENDYENDYEYDYAKMGF